MGLFSNFAKRDSSKILTLAFERLGQAKDLRDVTAIVAESARQLSAAQGATFILRDGDLCYYVDEHSISPLWKGKRFPMVNCISGWSMIHQEAVTIADIYQDNRIPHDAYRPTFVKSVCIIPIRVEKPIGAIGTYWSKSYSPSDDEIKSLQILANSTAIALENLELKIVLNKQNVATTGLQTRNNELEVAINSMAHDLRTPVAGMTGMAELLRIRLSEKIDKDSYDYLTAIMDTGRQTAAQIEHMLMLYRATNGTLAKQELNITQITQELINVLRPALQNRTVEFNVEPHLKAYADAPLVRVVLGNLLSNAIKYSARKPRTKIDIGLHKNETRFNTFYVRDNGDGFEPSLAAQLFQPLNRLHSQTDFSGTGLGLASVAKIVEVHGGQCHAEGRPSEGATFYFSLPTT